ncbi:MAG: hypothetical protein ACI85O_001885 [Saprospiraceae bacterium]|jgi:hypothetical protein
MATISIQSGTQTEIKSQVKKQVRPTILNRYIAMTERAGEESIIWYIKTIIAIPCVFMVLSIFAMAMVTPNYIWFVAITILLFYANVIVHMVGVKSTTFVPLYHATIAFMIVVPAITYLLSL